MRKISSRDRDLPYTLSSEEPFSTYGALSAIAGSVSHTGQLPQDWAALYDASREVGNVRYTVLSYSTPIAWTTGDGYLFIPDVRYSVTTSRHVGKLYRMASLYGPRTIRKVPDLSAPAEDGRPAVSPQSGEGALYSPEYLRSKTPVGRS